MMIVSGVVPPQGWRDWLANQSLDTILDGIEGFPRTAEGQEKMLPGSNTACDRTARSLCSRHIAAYNGSVPGSMGKSMKRPLPASTDLEVVPQKLARNELSTFSKNNPPGSANNHRESRNSDLFRMRFEHRMEGIIKKNRLQLLIETQKKKSELKSKENKAKRVLENLGFSRRSLGHLMHPMEYAFKVLLHDESSRKLIELEIEIQQLTFELKQKELQKKFRARVYSQAIRAMSNCPELVGGARRAVEEYMNKQGWVELLPLDALNQKSPGDQKK
ncbi:hypothetical protein [Endozoicomonas sp. GU-1]|uniref:hypothetical protein n=1 Tax=Endozoicomonas sp. GU-1 TaxID=3009078 RepID=UPI0022B4AA7B|nr:hypothetical protein [Endozoicomonas sp. GU-1]WBA80637.1 hypothetical protein O2T12_20285 [Endozoicomonas sp. GU-1]WBA88203.1 hypothetical protein O3276_09500 [Endozoicomonas sp. GU-1]